MPSGRGGGPLRARVHELEQLFPTGLVISPSYEAILPDIDAASIEAMLTAVRD